MSKNQGIIHGFKVFVCFVELIAGSLCLFSKAQMTKIQWRNYFVTEVNSRFLRELCKTIHTDAFSACTTKNAMEIYSKPR